MSSLDLVGVGLTPGFWEVGGYKNNVKRIRDGIEQLEDLSKMVKERAEIEAKYAKALQVGAISCFFLLSSSSCVTPLSPSHVGQTKRRSDQEDCFRRTEKSGSHKWKKRSSPAV